MARAKVNKTVLTCNSSTLLSVLRSSDSQSRAMTFASVSKTGITHSAARSSSCQTGQQLPRSCSRSRAAAGSDDCGHCEEERSRCVNGQQAQESSDSRRWHTLVKWEQRTRPWEISQSANAFRLTSPATEMKAQSCTSSFAELPSATSAQSQQIRCWEENDP